MKTFIVKRIKDKQFFSIPERNIKGTLEMVSWDGMQFVKQFELVGEEKNIDESMKELFG